MRSPKHDARSARAGAGEAGFTIIEVMIAIVLLVVGVLGLLPLIETSMTSTNQTHAREQGTNLAREIIERSRLISYASTTTALAPAALAASLPEAPAASGSTFVVTRRNIAYTVKVSACSIDDPSDGAGVGDTTFCERPAASTGPGSAPTGSGLAISANVLGLPIPLAVGGSLVDAVCRAVGADSAVLDAVSSLGTNLLSLAGNGAQLQACAGSGTGTIAFDTRPDDLRRIRVDVVWTQAGRAGSVSQTTLLTTPA
jgi:type IV pilus modification protein PilV